MLLRHLTPCIEASLRLLIASALLVNAVATAPASAAILGAADPDPEAGETDAEPAGDPAAQPAAPRQAAPLTTPQHYFLPWIQNTAPMQVSDLFPLGTSVVAAQSTADGRQERAPVSSASTAVTFLQHRVAVLIPAGTYPDKVTLELEPAASAVSAKASAAAPLHFTLRARADQTGQLIENFARPVQLIVDLHPLAEANPGQEWYLAYQDAQTPQVWHRPALTVHAAGLISVQTDHFSTWEAGQEPAAWKYKPVQPAIAAFSGAATYRYPVEVPGGRAGLTPNIDLAYSSRAADGLIQTSDADQGPLGLGWSLNTTEITRRGVHSYCCWESGLVLVYPDLYTLTLNGASYDLFPEPGRDPATTPALRYYAQNAPQVFVQRLVDEAAPNQDGLYWIVKTADGTTQRLGYTADAEVVQTGATAAVAGPAGRPGVTALRWLIDTATDVSGNQIQYDYANWQKSSGGLLSEGARPAEIRYNFAARAPNAATRVTGAAASRIIFEGADPHRINRIALYHVDLNRPVRALEIGLEGVAQGGSFNCGYSTVSQLVTKLQVVGSDGLTRVPATIFHYVAQAHAGTCFPAMYLSEVENGYGGRTRFTYTSDGREDASGGPARPPAYGRAYFVTTLEVWDGLTPQPALTRYEYSQPCYNQAEGDPGPLPQAANCPLQETVNVPGVAPYREAGTLSGFRTATATALDYGGAQRLRRTTSTFSLDRLTFGQPLSEEVAAWDGARWTPQQTTQTEYGQTTIANSAAGFAFVQSTTTRAEAGGQALTTRQDRVRYDAFGNVLETVDYAADGQPYRRTLNEYAANTQGGSWIVNTLTRAQVFAREAAGWASLPASETRTDYNADGDPATLAPDARGRRTATRQWDVDPVTGAARFVDTAYTYDDWGRPRTVTTFDEFGTEARYARQNPRVNETDYDPQYDLYPVRLINSLGHTTQIDYDWPAGLPLAITDANASVTRYRYDAFGRLTAVIRPGDDEAAPTQRYQYEDHVTPSWVATQQRTISGCATCVQVTVTFVDGLGRTVQARASAPDGQQRVTNRVYDALDRVVFDYLPAFEPDSPAFVRPADWLNRARTYTEYDALGRATRVIAPDGAATRTMYHGALSAVLDANGHQQIKEVDALGRLIAVNDYATAPLSDVDFNLSPDSTVRYAYTVRDQLTRVDTISTTTTFTINALGQTIHLSDPDLGEQSYRYDAAGKLQAQTDARGVTTTFTYDGLNRMTAKAYQLPPNAPIVDPGPVQFFYDEGGTPALALGRRTGMRDATGQTQWAYDARGHVLTETHTLTATLGAYTFAYAYDDADQVTALTYPDGETVTTTYDAAGQPSSLAPPDGPAYVDRARYDAQKRPLAWTAGNGLTTTRDYYALTTQGGRLRRLRVGQDLLDLGYRYDTQGNLLQLDDFSAGLGAAQTQHFNYDALGRLTNAWTTGNADGQYSETYQYDVLGHFSARTSAGETTAYRYADPAHPHAPTTLGTNHYQYDPGGNLTVRAEGAVTYQQFWTAENQLARVQWAEDGQVYTTTLIYDGQGRRTLTIEADGAAEVTTLSLNDLYEQQINTTPHPLSEEFFKLGSPAGRAPGRPRGLARYAARDYTGPSNRTISVWIPPQYVWGSAQVQLNGVGSCSSKPANPTKGTICGKGTGLGYDAASCGGLGQWPCQDGERYDGPDGYWTTVTYGPATASAGVSCTLGLNGWCIAPATVTLTGAEPMPGQTITGIGYSYNSAGTASSTQNVNPRTLVIDDTAPATLYYWAESSFGDQSALGTRLLKVDTLAPIIQLSGPTVEAWHVTNAAIGVGASDATAGVKCVRAQWDSWPVDDSACAATSASLTQPSQGVRTLYVRAWDNAGNQSTWQGVYRWDATPPANPTAAVSACAANDTWQNSCAAPTFTWSGASDADSGIDRYQYYWGPDAAGVGVGETAAASYIAGTVISGVDYLRVRTRDVAGNWSAWTTLFTFRYDAAPPVTLAALEALSGEAGWFQSAVTLTLTATDDLSGAATPFYRLADDQWLTYTAPMPFTASGVYTLEVRARDAVGNWEAAQTLLIKIDREPPSLAAARADEVSARGVIDGEWQNRVARPRFAWTGATDLPINQLSRYRVYWGPDANGTTPAEETEAAAFDAASDVPSGQPYTLRVQACDEAGLWSAWATLFTFKFDGVAPEVTPLTPAAEAVLTETRPLFSAIVADPEPGAGLAAVTLTLDQQIVTPTIASDALLYTPATPLTPGPHTFSLSQDDGAGNRTTTQRAVWVDPDTHLRWVTPAHDTTLNQTATAILLAGEPGALVTLTTASETFSHTLDASGNWEIPAVLLQPGGNRLSAHAVDAAGNQATAEVNITVDARADIAEAQADRPVSHPQQTPALFYVTALAGGERQVTGWELRLADSAAQPVALLTGRDSAERQAVAWDGLTTAGEPAAEGNYTYQLTVTTTGGLVTRSPLGQIEVVNTAPAAPTLDCGPNGQLWFSQPPALARGTASIGYQVVIYQNETPAFVTALYDGQWQQPISLAAGAPYSVSVTARTLDAAGNLSAPSAACWMGLSATDPFTQPHAQLSAELIGLGARVQITATTRADGAPLDAAGVELSLPASLGPAPTLTTGAATASTQTWAGEWQVPDAGLWQAPVTLVFNAADTARPVPNRGVQFLQPYLDLVPPYAQWLWPLEGQQLAQTVLFAQGAAEPFSAVTVTATQLTAGQPVTGNALADALGRWQAALTLADGRYRLTAQATDRAGNRGPATTPVTVTIDTTGPSISDFALTPAYAQPGQAVTMTAVIHDAYNDIVSAAAEVSDLARIGDRVSLPLDQDEVAFQGRLVIGQDAAEGLKPVVVQARDSLNNTNALTGTSLIVDGTPPELSAPQITITDAHTALRQGTVFFGPEASAGLNLTLTASDDAVARVTAGLASLAVLTPDGLQQSQAVAGVRAEAAYTFTLSALMPGHYRVRALDQAGNWAERSFPVVYDSTPPTLTVQAPPSAGLKFQVGWAGVDDEAGLRGYTVQWREANQLNWTDWLTETTATGREFLGQAGHLYHFRVSAMDQVGNTAAWQSVAVAVTAVAKTYRFNGQRVALRRGQAVFYLHGDHLGSVVLVTDAAGQAVSTRRYLPFGEERLRQGPAITAYGFTGQRRERFGLLDYAARAYDPALASFISPDSVVPEAGNPQDLNRYAYTRDNPVRYTDSSGHCIDGISTIPCLLILSGAIATAGFAGGAAYHQFRVTGKSWWAEGGDPAGALATGLDWGTKAVAAGAVAVAAVVAFEYFAPVQAMALKTLLGLATTSTAPSAAPASAAVTPAILQAAEIVQKGLNNIATAISKIQINIGSTIQNTTIVNVEAGGNLNVAGDLVAGDKIIQVVNNVGGGLVPR